MHLRDQQRLRSLVLVDVEAFRDLEVGGLSPKLLQQRAGAFADAMQRTRALQRDAHDTRLLCQSLEDRLPNPPHRVRDELDAFGLVELVGGGYQAEVALMGLIGGRDALLLRALG